MRFSVAFHTKTYEAYGNIRVKPNQPCNYLNRGHKSKVNIFGQYNLLKNRLEIVNEMIHVFIILYKSVTTRT